MRQEEKSKSKDKETEVQLSETIFDKMVDKEQEQVEDEADIFSSGKLAEKCRDKAVVSESRI